MPTEAFSWRTPTGLTLDMQTLRFLADAIPHQVWIVDVQGHLLYANQQWYDYTDIAKDEPDADFCSLVVHPLDRAGIQRAWQAAIVTGADICNEARLKRRDGIYRWYTIRATAQRDARGVIWGLVGTATEREDQPQGGQTFTVSAAELRALAETGPQMMWSSLEDGTLVYCNQRYLSYVQAPFEELQGSGWQRFVHPDDVERILAARRQAQASGEPYELEYRLKEGKTGAYRWFLRRVQPARDANGQIIKWFGLSTDIHEQKLTAEALRESDMRLRRLVESNIVGVTITDAGGTIHEANEAFLSLIGYDQEDLAAGRIQWTTLTPPEYWERDAQAHETLRTSGAFPPYEKAYIRKDGSRVPVAITGALFRWDGDVPVWMTLTLDLSAAKEVERQKDFFLAMTGHELKTPLAALKGMLQLIERRARQIATKPQDLSPALRTMLEDLVKRLEGASRQVDIQTHLINDLLDLSRLATQTLQLHIDCWDLAQLVQETVDDLQIAAPERVLVLVMPEQTPLLVQADRARIKQVVTNYITNALRYAPAEQPIQVGLTREERTACVWVRDRGPGLDAEAREQIWQQFHQVKGVKAQDGSGQGLGLGLYLCQQLIKAHQGQVGVESTPGKGSTFWFCLPMAPPGIK